MGLIRDFEEKGNTVVLVNIRMREGNTELARDLASEAADCDPSLRWPHQRLVSVATEGDAETQLEEALAQDPEDPALVRVAARRALRRAAYDEVDRYARELKRLGDSGSAHYLLGQAEEARVRYPQAVQQYRLAVGFEPGRRGYRAAVARLLERMELTSEAVAEYGELQAQGYRPAWVEERLLQLREKLRARE